MEIRTENHGVKNTLLSTLSLFTSLGTLVCCALPALFVTLGAGAALAGFISTIPWLVSLSKYKAWTFGISGVILLFVGFIRFFTRNTLCPTDLRKSESCARLRKISGLIYWLSVGVYALGFFFAFIAVHIFY